MIRASGSPYLPRGCDGRLTSDRPTGPRMFAAFQGLSWSMSRKGAADPRSEHVRRRRLRARSRFRVEALEPRWLLSTTASNPSDPDPGQGLITVSAVYRPTAPPFPAVLTDDWTTAQVLPDADAVKVKGEPSPG